MAMRDFTSETKQQLLKTVDEVSVPANDAWYKRFAEWFDDNNFSGTHALYLQEYENGFISFKDYQQNLLDWNNTSRQDIEKSGLTLMPTMPHIHHAYPLYAQI